MNRMVVSEDIKKMIPGYEIIERIGTGGMGSVYKARQVSMDRTVAIKMLPPEFSSDKHFISRFLREAKVLAKLNHPNIVTAIDAGEVTGVYYFVMEFVDGITTQQVLKKKGRLSENECLAIALQALKALEHAHKHGIIHRDIKPQNIMITRDKKIKLCDLGLAKRIDRKDESTLTMPGLTVGTPYYASPEQAHGEPDIDLRTDIYSLGATLYHLATGSPVFDAATPTAILTKHVVDEPESPKKKNPELSDSFCKLIMKMLQKKKEDRYQNASEITQDIQKIAHGKTLRIAPKTRLLKNLKPAYLAIPALFLISVIVLLLLPRTPQTPQQQNPASPVVDELQKLFEERFEVYQKMKAKETIAEIYNRLDTNRKDPKFKNTRYEVLWDEELDKFILEEDEKIYNKWLEFKPEVEKLENQGRLQEALARLKEFPQDKLYFYFSTEDTPYPTNAGREYKLLEKEILDKISLLKQPRKKFPHGEAKDLGNNEYEIIYHFMNKEEILDFEVVDKLPFAIENGLIVEGGGALAWNAQIDGDVEIEIVFTTQDRGLNLFFHTKDLNNGYGVSIDAFEQNKFLMFKLPLQKPARPRDRLKPNMYRIDKKRILGSDHYDVKENIRYTLIVSKIDDRINTSISAGDLPISLEATNDEFRIGRIAIGFLPGSKVKILGLRIKGKVLQLHR